MLGTLLKLNFQLLLSSLRAGRKKNGEVKPRSAGSTVFYILLLLFCCAVFAVMFFGLFIALGDAVAGTDIAWLAFAVMGIMVFLIDFFMTIFTAKSQLFEAKDNELLLSLPIRPRDILLSRMLMILLTDYLFEVMVALPAYVAWLVLGQFSLSGLVCFLLCLVFMPLLALSCACLVGWLLSLVTAHVKNSTIINTVLAMALFIGYMVVVMGLQNYMQLLITKKEAVAHAVETYLYPFACLGRAITEGSFLSALIYIAFMALPFALVCFILARSFLSLLTKKRGGKKAVYREKALRARSLGASLLAREFRRLLSSTTYLINSGIGIVMMLFCGVGSFFLASSFAGIDPALLQEILPTGAIAVLCFCGSTVMFTAPSISLEGQNIYDLKALPIPGRAILMAKLKMHLLIALPASLVASLCCIIALPCNAVMGVLLAVIPLLFHVFYALVGLMMNIAFPRFEWDSETVAVKQSGSVGLAMLINMVGTMVLIALAAVFVFLLSLPMWAAVVLVSLPLHGISIGLFIYLHLHGDRIVERLG